MPESDYAIPTRQDRDAIFGSDEPLEGSASSPVQVIEVAGYDSVRFFATTDVAFEIRVEQGCRGTGPFVVTNVIPSALVAGVQQAREEVLPCGSHMRATLINLSVSPQTSLEYCGTGIPEP